MPGTTESVFARTRFANFRPEACFVVGRAGAVVGRTTAPGSAYPVAAGVDLERPAAPLWQEEYVERHPENAVEGNLEAGFSGELLLALYPAKGQLYLEAKDVRTGQTRWKSAPANAGSLFVSRRNAYVTVPGYEFVVIDVLSGSTVSRITSRYRNQP